MHAASQQLQGTLRQGTLRAHAPWPLVVLSVGDAAALCTAPMIAAKPRQLHIQGITRDGRSFRPSDWAERLAGAMSCFRPGGGLGGISAFIGYSPLCVPHTVDGVKCVIVSEELRAIEPMAWDFVMNFARDNELRVAEPMPMPVAAPPAATQ